MAAVWNTIEGQPSRAASIAMSVDTSMPEQRDYFYRDKMLSQLAKEMNSLRGNNRVNAGVSNGVPNNSNTVSNVPMDGGGLATFSNPNKFSALNNTFKGAESFMPRINEVAKQFGIDPQIMVNMLHTESRFNPNAYNKTSGASGMAQFLPGTAKDMGIDPWNPDQAIFGMGKYLNQLSKMFSGDMRKAVAAYNFGPGNVRSGRAYPLETRNYLASVFGN
jgi:soluble lytic murein transglycosylase-like protein